MKKDRVLTNEQKNIQRRIAYLISEYCDGVQQVFADKVGITKSSVSQYVNGTNFPDNKRAGQIAHTFGINPVWVMGYDVPMEQQDPAATASLHGTLISKFSKLSDRDQEIVMNMIDSMLGSKS